MHTSTGGVRSENQRAGVPEICGSGSRTGFTGFSGTIDWFPPVFNTRNTSKRGMYIPGPCNKCLPTQRARHVFVPCFFLSIASCVPGLIKCTRFFEGRIARLQCNSAPEEWSRKWPCWVRPPVRPQVSENPTRTGIKTEATRGMSLLLGKKKQKTDGNINHWDLQTYGCV